jgi:hypothetical protein
MKIFDLTFSDGRTCRVIDPDPIEDADESLRSYQAVFKPGYLVGMQRIVAPPPEKLPWSRTADGWAIGAFALTSKGVGSEKEFVLTWPGGILASKSKEEVSAAVRLHWNLCV